MKLYTKHIKLYNVLEKYESMCTYHTHKAVQLTHTHIMDLFLTAFVKIEEKET